MFSIIYLVRKKLNKTDSTMVFVLCSIFIPFGLIKGTAFILKKKQ